MQSDLCYFPLDRFAGGKSCAERIVPTMIVSKRDEGADLFPFATV